MKILVSDHAKERVIQRFGCDASKVAKIATKAWGSTEKPSPRIKKQVDNWLNRNPGRSRHLRVLMGYAFIFTSSSARTRLLITVIHPKIKFYV